MRRKVWLKTLRIMSARLRSPHSKFARKTKSPAGFRTPRMPGWKWSTSTPSGITCTGLLRPDARNPSRLKRDGTQTSSISFACRTHSAGKPSTSSIVYPIAARALVAEEDVALAVDDGDGEAAGRSSAREITFRR